jgi:hypothetical protein
MQYIYNFYQAYKLTTLSCILSKTGRVCMFKIRKGYDSESKSFRLPVELIERMESLAAKNKLSLNQLVIQCCQYALNHLEDENKPEE